MSSKHLHTTLAVLCLALAAFAAAPAVAENAAVPTPGAEAVVLDPAQPDSPADIIGQLDQRGENRCIQITVWAQNLETGECQEFSSPCSVPEGWTLYFDPATCTNW